MNSIYYGLDVDEGDYLARDEPQPIVLPRGWCDLDEEALVCNPDGDDDDDAHVHDYLFHVACEQADALYEGD